MSGSVTIRRSSSPLCERWTERYRTPVQLYEYETLLKDSYVQALGIP